MEKLALSRTTQELRRDREWIASLGDRTPRGTAVRVESPAREVPQVPGATSAPDGEPLTVERADALHH